MVSPVKNTFHLYGTLASLRTNAVTLLLTEVHVQVHFLTNVLVSVPGACSGSSIMFSRLVFAGFYWLWQFLRLSWFLMILTIFRSTGQVFL